MIPVAGAAQQAAAQGAAAPVSVAPDEATASTAARKQGTPVRVAGLTSETTTVSALPTGKFALEQSVEPLRVRQGDKWVDIDTSLVKRADGSIGPKAAADVSFSGGGTGPMARIGTADRQVTLGWRRPLPAPVIDGAGATYAEVLPGVDLRVRATARGFAHEVVVKNRQAAANPELAKLSFTLGAKGVTVSADKAGNVTAVDAGGQPVFHAPPPKMWDSAKPPAAKNAPGEPAHKAKQAAVGVELGQNEVSLLPDKALLADPAAAFPIVIDPDMSYVTAGQSAWTLVRRSHPNASHWNLSPRDDDETHKGVGRVGREHDQNGTYLDRSLFQFDGLPIARGARIQKAQFQIFQVWKELHTCDANAVAPVELHATGRIDPGTTWNNQPGWGPTLDAVRSAAKVGYCDPTWIGFDTTNHVQYALDQGWNVSLGLKAHDDDEAGNTYLGWKRFFVQYHNNVPMFPKLYIEYNNPPDAPQGAWVAPWHNPCTHCGGLTYLAKTKPILYTKLTDPQGGNLRAIWDIVGQSPREQWLSSGSVFGHELDLSGWHGHTFQWSVRGNDGQLDGPSATGPTFVMDLVGPDKPPAVSALLYREDNSWHGGVNVSDTFTFTANGVGDVDHFRYGFQDPPSPSTIAIADALGGKASVTLTPPHDGPVDLYVQSVDRAGNLSPTKVYHFYVRAGDGLASHWSLDGDAKDGAFVGGRHGTANGGATWTPGAVGASVKLDGGEGEVTAPNAVVTNTSFSVSAWARLDAANGSRAIVSQDGNQFAGFNLWYRQDNGGKWAFAMARADDPGAGYDTATSSMTAQLNTWTHITGVYDAPAQQLRLYVNGSLAGSAARTAASWNAAGQVRIGKTLFHQKLVDPWLGGLDEVKIHDRPLSDAAVRAMVSRDNVQLGHWKFDEEPNRSVAKNAVEGNDALTLSNGAKFVGGGAIGGALQLDSGQEYASTSRPVVQTDQSFSVAAYVKLNTNHGAADGNTLTAVSQDGASVGGFFLNYRHKANNKGVWEFYTPVADKPGTADEVVQSAPPVRLDEWVHLAAVYDAQAKQTKLYVDGELAGTAARTRGFNATGPLTVGRGKWGGNPVGGWRGGVDELRLYSRPLAHEEIRAIVSRDNVTLGSWKLDGDGKDDSGNGRDGTPRGGPGWTGGQVANPDPKDLAFTGDGQDDHISAGYTVDTSKSFSVSAWVKLDNAGKKDDWPAAVSQDGTRTSGFLIHAMPDPDPNRPRSFWSFAMFSEDKDGGGARHVRATSSAPAQLGVWTHLTAVYNTTTSQMLLYVNGVHDGSATHQGAWKAEGGLQIGRELWYGKPVHFWKGSIDDVRAYSRPLFDEEIRLLAGRDLSLVHNLRLDEAAGTTAADSVGVRPGKVNGTASFGPGCSGNALNLDGNGYVSTESVDLRTDTSFTVATWVKVTRTGGQLTAVSMDGGQGSKFRLGHITDTENPRGAWIFEMPEADGSVTKAAVSTLDNEINHWVHLVGVYDPSTKRIWLYVNGARVGNGTLVTPWQGSGGLLLGRGRTGGNPAQFWPGSVDDVRLYTGGLTKERISALFKSYSELTCV